MTDQICTHAHAATPAPAQPDRPRIYVACLALQLLLGGYLVLYSVLTDDSPEQQIRFTMTTVAVTQFSFGFGQAYTFKMLIFDTCGQTIGGFLRGEPAMDGRHNRKHKWAAVLLTLSWLLVVTLAVPMAWAAKSTTNGFEYQIFSMRQLQLHVVFQFSAWAVFCHDMGMNRAHLCSVVKGEQQLAMWRAAHGIDPANPVKHHIHKQVDGASVWRSKTKRETRVLPEAVQ